MNIGASDSQIAVKKEAQAQYLASLNNDKETRVSDNLPDARRRTFYETNRKDLGEGDHPLGRSSMKALGSYRDLNIDDDKKETAASKRQELKTNRYDIISTLEKETNPMNSPRQMNEDMLVGVPGVSGKDDGIHQIGRSASTMHNDKKAKQREYMAQLNADAGTVFGVPEGRGAFYRDASVKRIEATGNTGFHISDGASMDMSPSMKNLDFDMKRSRQEAYRAALGNQQAESARRKEIEKVDTARLNDENADLPYMTNNSRH